ncbi:unnamed protein product [Urochloa humidicola]
MLGDAAAASAGLATPSSFFFFRSARRHPLLPTSARLQVHFVIHHTPCFPGVSVSCSPDAVSSLHNSLSSSPLGLGTAGGWRLGTSMGVYSATCRPGSLRTGGSPDPAAPHAANPLLDPFSRYAL